MFSIRSFFKHHDHIEKGYPDLLNFFPPENEVAKKQVSLSVCHIWIGLVWFSFSAVEFAWVDGRMQQRYLREWNLQDVYREGRGIAWFAS
jgi:hypothetical protein